MLLKTVSSQARMRVQSYASPIVCEPNRNEHFSIVFSKLRIAVWGLSLVEPEPIRNYL